MKVVLLALSSRYIHLSPAPYYLAAELEDYETVVLDHSVNEKKEDVLASIISEAPDVLGLSVYIWNLSYLKVLLPELHKALPFCHIVLGGPEVSYAQKETLLSFPFVRAVLSGEGEVPFRLLCDAIKNGENFDKIPSASYIKRDGSMKIGQAFVAEETPKSPLRAGYGEALKGRIAYMEASRGCPFRCAFCLSGRCGGVRFFNIEEIKADILALAKISKTIKFIDRTFNADRKRARDIFSFILSRYGEEIPLGTSFHFEIAGELLDEQTLLLLKKAPPGVFRVEIGVQSFHARTLLAIQRSDRLSLLKENIARLLSLGNVHVHIDLIAGLPEEDLETFKKSFDEAYLLSPHMLQCGFLKLLHGAPMREEPEKYPCVFNQEPPYEVQSTPWLSETELSLIHTAEYALDRLYNSHRYRRTLALFGGSPFSLFLSLGERLMALSPRATLEDEMTLVYRFFEERGTDTEALRDAMLLDFISTNSSRLMPKVLRREYERQGRIKEALCSLYPSKKGVRRAIVFLSGGRVAFADYEKKEELTAEYPVKILCADTLFLVSKTE